MDSMKIKINTVKGNKDICYVVNSLDKLDNVLSETIPKMFYYYKTIKEDIFIVVPEEFRDRIKEILNKTLLIDLGYSDNIELWKNILKY